MAAMSLVPADATLDGEITNWATRYKTRQYGAKWLMTLHVWSIYVSKVSCSKSFQEPATHHHRQPLPACIWQVQHLMALGCALWSDVGSDLSRFCPWAVAIYNICNLERLWNDWTMESDPVDPAPTEGNEICTFLTLRPILFMFFLSLHPHMSSCCVQIHVQHLPAISAMSYCSYIMPWFMHQCHETHIYPHNQPPDTWVWETSHCCICPWKVPLYMQLCEQIARHSM